MEMVEWSKEKRIAEAKERARLEAEWFVNEMYKIADGDALDPESVVNEFFAEWFVREIYKVAAENNFDAEWFMNEVIKNVKEIRKKPA